MERKELIDKILSQIDEEKRAAFVSEFRETNEKDQRKELLKKYGIKLTKEDIETLQANREVSDEELDVASGGCANCIKWCMCHHCKNY